MVIILFFCLLGFSFWGLSQTVPELIYQLESIDKAIGWVDVGNPRDTWQVEIPDECELIVTLSGMEWEKELDLVLMDSTGEWLDYSKELGSKQEYVQIHVPPGGGTYFLQVRTQEEDATGYTIQCFAPHEISVLALSSEDKAQEIETALQFLGITKYRITQTVSDFNEQTRNHWDLVILYFPSFPLDDLTISLLETYLKNGGALIVFDSDLQEDEPLLELMGATWLGHISGFFHITPTFASSVLDWLVGLDRIDHIEVYLGDGIQATAGRSAAILEDKIGVDLVIENYHGRAVLNSFLLDNYLDRITLLVSEIIYVLLASKWKGFESAHWWYREPVDEALELLEEAKFAEATENVSEALHRLVPLAPHEKRAFYTEDLIPGPKDQIEKYLQRIESTKRLLLRITDLADVISSFFNSMVLTPSYIEFAREAAERVESARVWLNDLKAEMERAEVTGLGCYPLPPGPIPTRLYGAEEAVSLSTFQVVNYSGQTMSITVAASSPLTEEEKATPILPPKSQRRIDLNPPLPPQIEITDPVSSMVSMEADGQEFGPYPVRFLPNDEFPLPYLFYPYLIAWVTPNAPFVQELLQSVQTCSEIWDLLQERNFGYLEGRRANTSWTQRIRLPLQVLDENGGTCIETAILWVTLFVKMGLEPLLMVIPAEQHAMPGWQSSEGLVFLETTLIEDPLFTFSMALLRGTNQWRYVYSKKNVVWVKELGLLKERGDVYILDVSSLWRQWKEVKEDETSG